MTENGTAVTYYYNAADQLISQTANGVTVNYTYDHRGNCIQESGSGKTVTMAYSVLGEMTEWSDGTLAQSNLYDYNGQRIKRTEGSDTDYYFYENGVVSVIEDSSSVTAANVLTNEGGLVGSFRGTTYHNYLTDVQGSTTNIIKEDGSLSAAYDYTDFGETTELTGNGFDNQVCYTGGIYDESTALYYLNARYYDPEIGRFISQDTYRGELDDPGQWHLYAYCANNPINYVDPSGHFTVRRWMVAVPIDIILSAVGVGLVFAPIKALCKAYGKALSRTSFRGHLYTFASKMKRYGNSIGKKVYYALKKIPVAKKYVKYSIVGTIESKLYSIVSTQVIYRLSSLLIQNIDLCLSLGGLASAVLDYAYDRKLNNVVYRL